MPPRSSSGELDGDNNTLHKRQIYFGREWTGLNQVSVPRLTVGQTLQALYRHNHCDVFGIGEDNQIYTAWLEQATWHGWFAIPMSNLTISKTTQLSILWRGPIDSIHRTSTHLDLFVVDTDGVVKTTYWEGEWLGSWFAIPLATLFSPGSKVTAQGCPSGSVLGLPLGNTVMS